MIYSLMLLYCNKSIKPQREEVGLEARRSAVHRSGE